MQQDVVIPAGPDGLTADWLTGALRAGGRELTVASLEVEPIGVGVGVMSLVFRVTPRYDGAPGPRTLVVKIAPPYEQIRVIAAGYRFYEREVELYRQLGPRLGLRPPALYFASFDAERSEFVVGMEDLGGLRSCGQLQGCPIEDARLVARQLARHHAAWWNDPQLATLPFLQSPGDPPYPQFHDQSMKASIPVAVERYGDLIPPRIHALFDRWSEIGPPFMEDVPNRPVTLIHGDVRLDNVFFHDDDPDDPVSVLDWQIAFISLGTFDLAYFMGQSLTVECRRDHEDELLSSYHAELVGAGVSDYPMAAMREDYLRSLVFCLCYPVTGGSAELANDRAVALIRAMLQRTVAAITDNDADALV